MATNDQNEAARLATQIIAAMGAELLAKAGTHVRESGGNQSVPTPHPGDVLAETYVRLHRAIHGSLTPTGSSPTPP